MTRKTASEIEHVHYRLHHHLCSATPWTGLLSQNLKPQELIRRAFSDFSRKLAPLKITCHMVLCLCSIRTISTTVEPHLADTPEKQTSTIMWTLCLVRNAISIDLHTIRIPKMWPPRYSVKRTLVLAPIVSLPIQTHPHSRYFGEKFVDLLVK